MLGVVHTPHQLAFLRTVEAIVRETMPPRFGGLEPWERVLAWRSAILDQLVRHQPHLNDLAMVPEPPGNYLILYSDRAYRLMSLRLRDDQPRLVGAARLRTNAHRWLLPAREQLDLFQAERRPGTPEVPVPIGVDPEGAVLVGWPDEVDETGVGWGMTRALRVREQDMVHETEVAPPAPDEIVPRLVIPAVRRTRHKE